MRSLIGSHAKVPIEHLYLETGSLPLSYVISARRMIYLKTLLDRHDGELTRRVYNAQLINITNGDWCELIKSDFKFYDIPMNEQSIKNMSIFSYKKFIKQKVRNTAFKNLQHIKNTHSKVKNNHYNYFAPQEYLLNKSFTNEQCSLLFNLRCRSVRDIKRNFPDQNGDNGNCPLCEVFPDTQEHLFECVVLRSKVKNLNTTHIKYDFIFSDTNDQKEAVSLIAHLLSVRDKIITKEGTH